MTSRWSRRTLLSSVGVTAGAGLAGCLQLEAADDESGDAGSGDDSSDRSLSLDLLWEIDDLENVPALLEDRYGVTRPTLRVFAVENGFAYIGSPFDCVFAVVDPGDGSVDSTLGEHASELDTVRSLHVTDDVVYLLGAEEIDDDTEAGRILLLSHDDDLLGTISVADDRRWISGFALGQDQLFVGASQHDGARPRAFEVFDSSGQQVFLRSWPEDEPVNRFRDFDVHDGIVYLGELNTAFAYDVENEALFEPSDRYGFSHEQYLTIEDGVMYTSGGYTSKVIDLDVKEVRFTTEVEGLFAPLRVGETVVVGGPTGLHGYDAESGAERWHRRTTSDVDDRPFAIDGVVYAIDDSDILYAIRAEDGSVLYDESLPNDGRGSIYATDRYLLTDSPVGTLAFERTIE